MDGKKKAMLGLLIAGKPTDDDDGEEEAPEVTEDEAKTAAAEAAMAAFKSGDVPALTSALTDFVRACTGYAEEPKDEE